MRIVKRLLMLKESGGEEMEFERRMRNTKLCIGSLGHSDLLTFRHVG